MGTLVLGFNNGRLLPAVVPFAHRQSRGMSSFTILWKVPRRPGSGLANGVVRTALDRMRERGPCCEGVPDHRGERRRALARGLSEVDRPKPELFPSHVQGRHRGDAEGICGGASCKRVRQGLASGNSVTETIYDAGFNSSGRFYEKSTDMLGMTPSQYRAGGTDEEIKFAIGQATLGAFRRVQQEGRSGDLVGRRPGGTRT